MWKTTIIYLLSLKAFSLTLSEIPLDTGFLAIESPEKFRTTTSKKRVQKFCTRINKKFRQYNWHKDLCSELEWKYDLTSKNKHPLLYIKFGTGNNVTLILGGVHPDEITPIHLPFKISHYLHHHPQELHNKNNSVVIAPLVNPDGFFIKKLLRNNGTVDPNRNFLTYDWYQRSFKNYKNTKQQQRKFPGFLPASEPETLMQKELIEKFKPKKIISIHAPLNFYDYDGPAEQKPAPQNKCKHKNNNFIHSLSSCSKNHKVVNFRIFPGSLGNFCGAERGIPTVTLELKTTRADKALEYWAQFKPALIKAINYNFLPRTK